MDKPGCKERVLRIYVSAKLCLLMDCPSVADPDSGSGMGKKIWRHCPFKLRCTLKI
jgi:hypothetical protein